MGNAKWSTLFLPTIRPGSTLFNPVVFFQWTIAHSGNLLYQKLYRKLCNIKIVVLICCFDYMAIFFQIWGGISSVVAFVQLCVENANFSGFA